MPSRRVRFTRDLIGLFKLFRRLAYPFTVEWTLGEDRTGQQNRLQWKWASEAGEQFGETAGEVQRRWKLDHGLPILCEDSAEYRSIAEALERLDYEQRKLMMAKIAVTSEMNVRQMVKFMDAVERECLEQGIVLTQPDQDLADYQRRYRTPERKAA